MRYYPEPYNHNRDKDKVLLYLSSYTTKKELGNATGGSTIQLLKKDFIDLKAEVEKADIDELIKVPSGLSNLKTKIDVDAVKLKTVHIDLNKLSDVVS